MRISAFTLGLLLFPLIVKAQSAATLPPFESPPVLDARDILRPEFLGSPLFSVRTAVPTKEGLNRYTLDSAFGVMTADGNAALIQRIADIQAIAKLQEVSRSDAYRKALARAAKSPLDVAGSAIKHPVDTVGGVGKGLWKMVNGAGQMVKEAGQGRKTSPHEDSVAEDAIGFGAAKRRIALGLGVDPYSSNEQLQSDLKKVAWAAYGGQMTFTGALLPLGGVAGIVVKSVQSSGLTLSALRDLSPVDLRLRNLKILLAMGIDRNLANSFFNNPALSPTTQTIIVDCLDQLRGVPGRDKYLRLAAASDDASDALRYQESAQLLVLIHQSRPLDLLSAYHGLPLALTRDDVLIAPLVWDYAAWTPGAKHFLENLRSGRVGDRRPKAIHIYLSGVASPSARAAAAASQVGLTERALPGPLR
ncbi:MAG TPA: hypothetical protein VNB29_07680 [Chthoniobacterales bacterium]|nr:hypothetical protein [Chthoniobacterales bacterium]